MRWIGLVGVLVLAGCGARNYPVEVVKGDGTVMQAGSFEIWSDAEQADAFLEKWVTRRASLLGKLRDPNLPENDRARVLDQLDSMDSLAMITAQAAINTMVEKLIPATKIQATIGSGSASAATTRP